MMSGQVERLNDQVLDDVLEKGSEMGSGTDQEQYKDEDDDDQYDRAEITSDPQPPV